MSNGGTILSSAEFENQIKDLSDRKLIEFTARQLYDHCRADGLAQVERVDMLKRIGALETGDKKTSSITGGVTGGIAAAFVAAIDWLIKGRTS
jgi:hypothetical protein